MNNKSTGAYLRRRQVKLTKKGLRNGKDKLIIRAQRSYKESNRIFNG
ncbi:hypothetical protein [Pseudoalteromonas sp. MQS005]|jgi:hypothetical protein|nr:hypothetical protein [Pseudoalteromonas sp. MQS005]